MNDETLPILDAARLRADYEHLRADALAGGGQGWRWGRSVLVRAGLAAWIATWSEHAVANVNDHRLVRSDGTAAPVGDSKPLVSLLALMLLACTKSSTDAAVAS